MARIAGVDLPREKRVEIGLTYVYGIGRVTANKILAEAGVNPDTRVRELTDDEAIVVFVIVKVCPFVVRKQRPMQEHVRVLSVQ